MGPIPRFSWRSGMCCPGLKDIVEGVMKLMANKSNEEGIAFLSLDFRDAFKQLHIMESERRFLTGSAMNGFFVYNTVLFGIWSGRLVWCRVAAWVMRSTQAWLTRERAQSNCFVDDPVIPLVGTETQRKKAAMGCVVVVLFPWIKVGFRKRIEKS